MTVKLPWTDRRSRTLRAIDRLNVNLPSVDLGSVQVSRPAMPRIDVSGIRAPELPDIRLPNMEIRRIDLPRVDLSRVDLPHFDMPHVDLRNMDLPDIDLRKVDLPHIDLRDIDVSGVGRTVGEQLSGIVESLSDTLAESGDRARDVVSSMAANLPADMPLVSRLRPRRSSTRPRILAIAAASAVAAAAAGLYLLFAPGSGARHRDALRRRLQGTPAAAQRGIGVAVESAKQVGDRAAELVRVPIETARDKVTGKSDGTDQSDGTPSDLFAVDAIDEAALDAGSEGSVDMTAVAIESDAGEDGFIDADASASIYGEPHILTDDVTQETAV
jgi:hypothetical protein